METLLGMANQLLGVDDRNNWNELQGNFCGVISVGTMYFLNPPADCPLSVSHVSWERKYNLWPIKL